MDSQRSDGRQAVSTSASAGSTFSCPNSEDSSKSFSTLAPSFSCSCSVGCDSSSCASSARSQSCGSSLSRVSRWEPERFASVLGFLTAASCVESTRVRSGSVVSCASAGGVASPKSSSGEASGAAFKVGGPQPSCSAVPRGSSHARGSPSVRKRAKARNDRRAGSVPSAAAAAGAQASDRAAASDKRTLSPTSKLKEGGLLVPLDDPRGRPLHDVPHSLSRPSLLSHHTRSLNLRGLYNLTFLLLIVMNFGSVLTSLRDYGLMIRLPTNVHSLWHDFPVLACFAIMHVCILLGWFTERLVAGWCLKSGHALNGWVTACMALNFAMVFLLPTAVVVNFKPNPPSGVLLLGCSVVWLFKMVSFHHVCYDVRLALVSANPTAELAKICRSTHERLQANEYPKSLTLSSFYRYFLMPTMCFQFAFPRTPQIRWVSVARHISESCVCFALMKVIVDQHIVPIAQNTFNFTEWKQIPLSHLLLHFYEHMLKLSVPSLYCWLLMFLGVFHHCCNILAEVTRFGDREFYEDWWNASSFAEYWRKWNLPIHHFMQRHIYKPLLRRKCPKNISGAIVFLVSAVFHEYLVVVPLQLPWIGWCFWALMAQVPLMHLTNIQYFQTHKTIGNVFFWCVFCFTGQPLVILIYWYLWGIKQGELSEFDINKLQMQ
eukprot:GHVT01019129.1.p1 GENE.GHVT01019129.1~~GHVT01019129.1.p1  ORF type:complete len:659 (+),score=106.68 GHVT01019129.1:502-2478(+)